MGEPTIIKEFPGQAVEEYRRTHGGKLPSEDSTEMLPGADVVLAADNPERVVARMSITLAANGMVSATGPLEQRELIIRMALGALDISYEVAKAAQQRAQIAAAPPPKKWSKAWWAQEFRSRAAARQEAETRARANLGES